MNIEGLYSNVLNYSMCRKLQTKTFPAACMLVLFLSVSLLGSQGTLLCFGKDGHVAVEFVDSCNGAGLGSRLEEMESDACGPCNDAQFRSSPAITNNALHYMYTLALGSSFPVLSSLHQEEYFQKSVVLPVSSHHNALASLNSVILLI